jgi:hypothetical protein
MAIYGHRWLSTSIYIDGRPSTQPCHRVSTWALTHSMPLERSCSPFQTMRQALDGLLWVITTEHNVQCILSKSFQHRSLQDEQTTGLPPCCFVSPLAPGAVDLVASQFDSVHLDSALSCSCARQLRNSGFHDGTKNNYQT